MGKVKITNPHPTQTVTIYPGRVVTLPPLQSVVVDEADVKGMEVGGRVKLEDVSEEKGPSSPRRLRATAKPKSREPKETPSSGTTNEGSE